MNAGCKALEALYQQTLEVKDCCEQSYSPEYSEYSREFVILRSTLNSLLRKLYLERMTDIERRHWLKRLEQLYAVKIR